MRIAYILYSSGVISGRSNGIRSQALSWKKIVEKNGVECVLINNWEHYDWLSFDAIHIFGYDVAIDIFVTHLKKKNSNIFLSPIIDSDKSPFIYKIASYNGLEKMRLYSSNYALRQALKKVQGVCVRSNHEKKFVRHSLDIPDRNVFLIPLSHSLAPPAEFKKILDNKESYCLHVSSIYQQRKNVLRLIQAAKKYNFKLVLAGNKGSEKDYRPLQEAIGDSENIEVLGFVDDSALQELYTKAKVFALPSLNEGVGIVALDAAVYGCKIVITDIGAPKEYYLGCADGVRIINPYDVDAIGKAVIDLMNTKSNINLFSHISTNYSEEKLSSLLIYMYTRGGIEII